LINYAAICKISTEEDKNPPIKTEIEGVDGTFFCSLLYSESLLICQDGFSFLGGKYKNRDIVIIKQVKKILNL